jgi:hypothetical protein
MVRSGCHYSKPGPTSLPYPLGAEINSEIEAAARKRLNKNASSAATHRAEGSPELISTRSIHTCCRAALKTGAPNRSEDVVDQDLETFLVISFMHRLRKIEWGSVRFCSDGLSRVPFPWLRTVRSQNITSNAVDPS